MTSFSAAVIVGGGPVGSLVAYQLARFGCKPLLVEQDDKTNQPCYGRATTLWPRTIEILDQIDIAERLIQLGVATRSGLHFHDGKRVHGGLMYGARMDKLGDTFYKFALHLRQRLTEEQLSDALEEYGISHRICHRFERYSVDESDPEYPITVIVRDLEKDVLVTIKTKYLVGADGGKSTVRKLANISFIGDSTTSRWIRMDAKVSFPVDSTSASSPLAMPNPRSLNSIDSASHGQILWCPADNGLTRIGYVFSAALIEKYGGEAAITKEIIVEEAKKALAPFNAQFNQVDWWTIYGIGQRIASTFCTEDRVFLAGDACHTHSSGSAQGLNTGVHDAINLSWKLALRIRGLVKQQVLDSYDTERRPVVQQVIDNDRTLSTLISGHYPEAFKGRTEPTKDLLTEWFDDMNRQSFTLGFGITYANSCLNSLDTLDPSRCVINPGQRGPDVMLSSIGTGDPVRLHKILKNDAKFGIVVFAGNPAQTQKLLLSLQASLSRPESFIHCFDKVLFRFVTITSVSGNGGHEVLGITPFGQGLSGKGFNGKLYFDPLVQAHEIYGVDPHVGAVVVFRPDGWIAKSCALDNADVLDQYFAGILEKKH
ncbi:FAD binding domain-containing protein [Mycena floridula]|nr:FAD binding domain-containing protein [Mycena floridula]